MEQRAGFTGRLPNGRPRLNELCSPMARNLNLRLLTQFAVSTGIGCIVFLALHPDPNPKVPLFGGLIVGFFGGWAAMFLYVWLRYGWKTAKTLRWDGN